MLLECHNLNYSYPGTRTPVLANLSFSIQTPGFHAVFGPSGRGKTSLAKLIASPLDRKNNKIITNGMETILYSYNLERLPGWSSVGNHLDRVTPQGKDSLRDKLISVFELGDFLSSRFANLSMGQQNRMNLIRYLLQDFDMLILDESLANVDEKLKEKIILTIKEVFPDKMFLYISHNLVEVSKFCNQILVLGKEHDGQSCLMVKGNDLETGSSLDKTRLEKIMLEVMNAL